MSDLKGIFARSGIYVAGFQTEHTDPGDSTVWPDVADYASLPSANLRTGDYCWTEAPGRILWQYDGADWKRAIILWNGTSTGQQVADLPTPGDGATNADCRAIINDYERAFTVFGGAWVEFPANIRRFWGQFAGTSALNTYAVAGFTYNGDTFEDTSEAGTTIKEKASGSWVYASIQWDGVSAGETVADLPGTGAITGAYAVVGNRGFVWTGSSWDEVSPGLSAIFGSYAGDAAANAAITTTYRRTDDRYTDSTGAGTTIKRWSGAAWEIVSLDWDGTTAGQLVTDLPTSGIYTGALATVGARGFEWGGASWTELGPATSVATFSALPVSAPTGALCIVTAQSGLTTCIVRKTANSGEWALERVTCAESAIPTLGSTADTWYSSGGISVVSADGAWLYDSTYGRTVRWWPAATLGTDGVWIPPHVYVASSKTLLCWASGTEDNATLSTLLANQGWTSGYVASAGGGTATVTSDGTRISLATTCPGSGGAATAFMYYNDAGGTTLTSTANVWCAGLVDLNTPTGNEGRSCVIMIDGAQAYDIGTARFGGSTIAEGQWNNAASSYTAYTAQVAGTVTVSAETLCEVEHRTGYTQARFGGAAGRWSALSSATARASASKQVYFPLVQANQNGSTAASATVRKCCVVVWA